MTTATPRKKATKKPLRIRPEILPESVKYITIDDIEYVAMPVKDFGDWYEDVEDGAVVRYAHENPEPLVPADEVKADLKRVRRIAKR